MGSQWTLVTLPEYSPAFVLVGSLIFALLVVILVVFISRSRASSKKNLILLVGNEDAGKTAILSTIVHQHTVPTHTSYQVNSAYVPESFCAKKHLHMVDVPGHPRLRDTFKTYIPDARAVVFVVDVSTITRNGRDVAEHLHHVLHALTSLPLTQSPPPLLILAHKTDLLLSSFTVASKQHLSELATSRVRTVLERELEKRRQVALGGVGVEGLGAEGEGTEMGGLECGSSSTFRFSEWEGGKIEFAASYVEVGWGARQDKDSEKETEQKSGEIFSGLKALKDWIDELP